MIKILKIKGNSMSPRFQSGDFVILENFFSFSRLRVGKIVIFHHQKMGLLIKAITSIDPIKKTFRCRGLNRLESVSEEKMGEVGFSSLRGFPLFHIPKG